ncbi:hypothetical protein FXF50_11130 [Micromonospora sp. AP08]|uniref:5'-methylthioadenosine/S-adenosylhomocysteine nucleosidase family protein n=1 Tax=Micromonospora sp. AP08 TaxID=2604467 RepID=UPI0011D78075|nr:hypothetical protein [Micromonospora sp. AP08]TYB38201.1 hypothetical protein FXF50_11130 [Micromonospora sp. AP08]
MIRGRAPLAILLYTAARDGRLVWRNPDSLALLRPPGDTAQPTAGGLRLSVLRRLSRGWDVILFALPPTLLLAGAGLAALFAGADRPAAGAFALLLVCGALLHVAVLLSCLVVAAGAWFFRQFGRPRQPDEVLVGELVPGQYWTMTLCHHVDGSRLRPLLDRTERHLAELLRARIRERGRDEGVELPLVNVTETLVCLAQAGTTQAMRDAVHAWTRHGRIWGAGVGISVRMSAHRAVRAPERVFDRGGFLFWYVAGMAVLLVVAARLVADWERAACLGECRQHPVHYWPALRWLVQRLFFTDPYGLTPATRQAWTIGVLTSFMSLMGLFVGVAAVRQYVRARDIARRRAERELAVLNEFTRTVIMVATDEEHQAVREAVWRVNRTEPEFLFLPHQTVVRLGPVGRTQIMLVQVEPGSVGPGSAAISAAALVGRVKPDFLILTGICYGLRPDKHEFGDILVCDQLRAIDHRKVAEPAGHKPGRPFTSAAEAAAALEETTAPDGPQTLHIRGDYVTPSPGLISRFKAVGQTWNGGEKIHFGPLLSASTLVSSRALRDELHAQQPEAIGGEMEGAGVYAAAAHAKVDWIVVKAICDWGFHKSDDFHKQAASNAARFVVRTAELGALDDAPAPGEI